MPTNEFLRQVLDDVFHVKGVLLAFNVGVEQDLEQEIAQFFPEMAGVVVVQGVKDLNKFLQGGRVSGIRESVAGPRGTPAESAAVPRR